jgi:hypothetical protein
MIAVQSTGKDGEEMNVAVLDLCWLAEDPLQDSNNLKTWLVESYIWQVIISLLAPPNVAFELTSKPSHSFACSYQGR